MTTHKDTDDMQRVIGELLGRLDIMMAPSGGRACMHTRGQTPDWYVEAAKLAAFGTLNKGAG